MGVQLMRNSMRQQEKSWEGKGEIDGIHKRSLWTGFGNAGRKV